MTDLLTDITVQAVMARAGEQAVFWEDTPGPDRIPFIRDVLVPEGYREGASVGLLRDARGVRAALHLSLRDPRHVGTTREVVAAAAPAAAQIVARLLSPAPHLTTREMDVLSLIAGGRTNREIAARLGISPRTVATHVESLLAKLEVTTRAAAVAQAFRSPVVHTAHLGGR